MSTAAVPAVRGAQASTLQMLGDIVAAQSRTGSVDTIAVVGNAPLRPSSQRAAAIDAADLVVRVNGYRTDIGGEPCVGSRTDVVVFNRALRATPWFFAGYRNRLHLLVEPGRLHWERPQIPDWWPADLGFLSVPNREVTVPACFDIGVDAYTESHWPTTGTLAAWMMLHMFRDAQILLAGYSFLDDPHQASWSHATGAPSPVGEEHLITREAELMGTWLREGRASLA